MKKTFLKKSGLRAALSAMMLFTAGCGKSTPKDTEARPSARPTQTLLQPEKAVYPEPMTKNFPPSDEPQEITPQMLADLYETRCVELSEKMMSVILDFECVNRQPVIHPYLDTKGLIHVGYGSNIDSWDRFSQIEFVKNAQTGELLSEPEKKAYYNKIRQMKPRFKTRAIGSKKYNRRASTYQKYFTYTATAESMYRLCQSDIRACITDLETTLAQEDILLMNMPDEQILALIDIRYSTGNLSADKWPKLYKALKSDDFLTAAHHSHRSTVSFERNDWTARQMIQSAQSVRSHLGSWMQETDKASTETDMTTYTRLFHAQKPRI